MANRRVEYTGRDPFVAGSEPLELRPDAGASPLPEGHDGHGWPVITVDADLAARMVAKGQWRYYSEPVRSTREG